MRTLSILPSFPQNMKLLCCDSLTPSNIPHFPQNDLFEKAKDEILDKIAALHKLTPLEWETLIQEALWNGIQHKVVDEIYLDAAECHSVSHFNTKVHTT